MTAPEIIPPRRKIKLDLDFDLAPAGEPDFDSAGLVCEVCGTKTHAFGHRNFHWTDALRGKFEITGSRVDTCYHCAVNTPRLYDHGVGFRDQNFFNVARSLAAALGRETRHAQ